MSTDPSRGEIDQHRFLIDCWWAGVESVKGRTAAHGALSQYGPRKIDRLLAVGKAASSMCIGAVPHLEPETRCLMITKYGHVDRRLLEDRRFEIIESAHPVPDEKSLAAGARAIDFVESVSPDHSLVLLVSGGASALVEVLPEGLGLEFLSRLTNTMLASGFDIGRINAVRTRVSRIKGGKLLARCRSRSIHAFLISDVASDDPGVIGSGIGSNAPAARDDTAIPEEIESMLVDAGLAARGDDPTPLSGSYAGRIIASNTVARAASERFARNAGLDIVLNEESLHGDIHDVVQRVCESILSGPPGVYIFGGEPTVMLPPDPGKGGRMQHLALEIARCIRGRNDIRLIAAGTDGTDGPTDAAGGIVDGSLFGCRKDGNTALDVADSGTFLRQAGGLFVTGPTGTNVMDLVIALKRTVP